MKQILKNLCKCSIIAIVAALTVTYSDSFCATNGGRVSNTATRAQNRVGPRASTKVSSGATQSKSTTTNATSEFKQETTQEATPEPTSEPEKPIIVNNKSSKFDSALNDVGGTAAESDDDALMRKIREQRAALDAADAAKDESNRAPSVQKCDIGLRDCMTEKCGADFSKCANDSETVWGSKIDACRTKTTCTAHEYAVLAPEIHADRDMNVHMSFYRAVLNCGDQYNSCIFNICGADLSKCLSKKEGDAAIEKCASIAKDCKQQDSGLAARVMGAFGDIRQIASTKAKRDEERLYELRDKMRETCRLLGAMFDERTLDCVFTVNFFAGDSANTPTASKKLYAGDSFQCEPEWFGIDVTTFKENAYRLTRSQTSASSAALGAGVGTAAGLISSGAINRAIETQKAKKEYENAQKELKEQEGKDGSNKGKGGSDKGKPSGTSSGKDGSNNSNTTTNGEKPKVEVDAQTKVAMDKWDLEHPGSKPLDPKLNTNTELGSGSLGSLGNKNNSSMLGSGGLGALGNKNNTGLGGSGGIKSPGNK